MALDSAENRFSMLGFGWGSLSMPWPTTTGMSITTQSGDRLTFLGEYGGFKVRSREVDPPTTVDPGMLYWGTGKRSRRINV